MDDTFESYRRKQLAMGSVKSLATIDWEMRVRVLMTLNSRLATAAAAIVKRITNRSTPRVFRPVSPFKKGSTEAGGIVKGVDGETEGKS